MESVLALMAGLMDDAKAATSMCRSHTTGWPWENDESLTIFHFNFGF